MDQQRTAVVVATARRHHLATNLLEYLDRQECPPDLVVVAAPDVQSLPQNLTRPHPYRIQTTITQPGLTHQRNAGLHLVPTDVQIVFFFDDDAIPRADYIANATTIFAEHPDVVGLTGHVVIDGASEDREISLGEALAAIQHSVNPTARQVLSYTDQLYGCNFAARRDNAIRTGFDERLPLYGWLEDRDFSLRLAKQGRLVVASQCVVAHLGSATGGRTRHVRFGYSQLVNPIYLVGKGSMRWTSLPKVIGRPLISNIVGSFSPRLWWRRRRLLGNALALFDLARGIVNPERAAKLQ